MTTGREASWRYIREMDRGEGDMGGRGEEREHKLEIVRSYKPVKPNSSPVRLQCLSLVQNLPKQGHQ